MHIHIKRANLKFVEFSDEKVQFLILGGEKINLNSKIRKFNITRKEHPVI